MDKKRLQFIFVSVLFFGILFALPSIGNIFRNAYVRIYSFVLNIAHSQESGALKSALEAATQELASRDALINDLQNENEFLRERLQIEAGKESVNLLLALVVGQGSGFGEETLIINKGSSDGLGGREAVIISPDIVIGVIDELFRDRAVVKLLFDSNFMLNAKTVTGVAGVLKGETGSRVILDEVSQAAKLSKDDLVVTTSEDIRIPPHIPVGRIGEILSKPTDIFQRAEVKPLFDPNMVERVFVILLE